MTVLVIGGSKCGKSSYAESLFSGFNGEKFYVATMLPFGDEAHAAIERHRAARLGKGFSTLEVYTDLENAEIPSGCGVLLEDLGNLCANEMFSAEKPTDPTEKILRGIENLRGAAELLVTVSNSVFADGVSYPRETALYMEYLARLNSETARLADRVVECVYGIPVTRKELP